MRRNLVMLVGLALLWGASFMFIKIADRHLEPATLVLGRLAFASLTLRSDRPLHRRHPGGLRRDEGQLALAGRRGRPEHGIAVLATRLGRDAH
jgi:drug/metabolite transporter (DMT)-like permease